VTAAEECHDGQRLRRITYVGGGRRAEGVAAIGRSLEHVNLAWAAASWIARLPIVLPILQLVTDAAGGGPRSLADPAPAPTAEAAGKLGYGRAAPWRAAHRSASISVERPMRE
jgi:hypothetical protein